jgi:3-hydroxyisobutyrate dehydrogenase-like beta-hydroxyacid dehydrogenase
LNQGTNLQPIAVLGIGMMGYPMARRLCDAGFTVTAWNRSPEKAQRLTAHGARVPTSLTDAVTDAGIVISLLENGQVVENVLFQQGAAAAMARGSLFIDMASITPRQARDHATRLQAMGIRHMDAPVSGGTLGAEAGQLVIMAGGSTADFGEALPVFKTLGRATHVGSHGAGQVCKLANQLIVGVSIGAVAEAMLLAERGGASAAKFKEAVSGGFADSRILQVHGQRMIEQDFAKRGAMSVQLKDMNNILSTAQELGMQTPIAQLLKQLFEAGCQAGDADLDHSALWRELARRNGMLG